MQEVRNGLDLSILLVLEELRWQTRRFGMVLAKANCEAGLFRNLPLEVFRVMHWCVRYKS